QNGTARHQVRQHRRYDGAHSRTPHTRFNDRKVNITIYSQTRRLPTTTTIHTAMVRCRPDAPPRFGDDQSAAAWENDLYGGNMKVGFKDDSFAFEFVRNLGFMYYGGADLGEMIATAEQITEGDFESWYEGWHKRAQRTLSRADADFTAGHFVSARESYLR